MGVWKSNKTRNRMMVWGLLALLAGGMSFPVYASSNGTKTAASELAEEASKTSLSDAQKEKESLEADLEEAKAAIRDLKESKGDVQQNLKELNRKLMDISGRITQLENDLVTKTEEIQTAEEKLAEAKQKKEQQYAQMKVRIQFMYENGRTSYLDALLSAESLTAFMNAAEYISDIESYDRQRLDEYGQTILDVADQEAALERDYADLEEMKATVEEEKASVDGLMQQKEEELAGLADEIASAQSEAEYFEAEIKAQEELIAEIKRIEAEKAAAGVKDNPYSGGTFTWPCPSSTRVTSNFGTRVAPMAGASTNHKGIDIGASYGADIVAAAAGTVKAATYSSSGGNYVMIDHGGGLYTVYMHASSLTVSAGDKVAAGDVIAKVGSTGISTGNHLHFGVSLDGSYVSPWDYLGKE